MVGPVDGERPGETAAAAVPSGAGEQCLERTEVEEFEFFGALEVAVELVGRARSARSSSVRYDVTGMPPANLDHPPRGSRRTDNLKRHLARAGSAR